MAKKKKEKKGGKHLKKKELVEILLNYFRTKPNEAFSLKQCSGRNVGRQLPD